MVTNVTGITKKGLEQEIEDVSTLYFIINNTSLGYGLRWTTSLEKKNKHYIAHRPWIIGDNLSLTELEKVIKSKIEEMGHHFTYREIHFSVETKKSERDQLREIEPKLSNLDVAIVY